MGSHRTRGGARVPLKGSVTLLDWRQTMKKILFLSFLLACTSLFSQSKIWKQTTSADFAAGTFANVVDTTSPDGELQLIHPLVQVGNDTLDPSPPRYAGYDDAGNYVQGWITSKMVYAQKFNNLHQPVSEVISVNASARANESMVGVALLNDGRFVVGWADLFDSTNGYAYSPRYCQFFDASNAKVGNNVRIFNLSNATETPPIPVADQINKRFLIVGTEGNSTKGFQLYGWLYTPSGAKLRDSIKIVPSSVTKSEFEFNGAFHNGKFGFVWSGDDDGYGPNDTYFMLADSNCAALMTPVMTNDDSPPGSSPTGAFDDAGNYCATWKWDAGVMPGPPGIVYGRVFDFSGRKIGGVIQLTHLQSGGVYWQNLSTVNGMFRLACRQGFYNGEPERQWASYWKLMPITSGNYVSGIFDAGSQQTTYQQFSWKGMTPPGARLKFQLRSSISNTELLTASWNGPSSTEEYYTNSYGETVNAAMNLKRYLQVKAFFEADTVGLTPVLNDFSVSYSSADSVAPVPVSNVQAYGEHRRIVLGWNPSPSADLKAYRLYRAVGGASFDPASFIELPAQSISYVDSSVSFDAAYRYGISAIDETFNESPIIQTPTISPITLKIFVSPSGTKSGEGTSLKPFSTIGDGITFSGEGDTVYVLPGTYTEDIALKEGIWLIGSDVSTTKVVSTNSNFAVTTAPNSTVQGFTFLVAGGIIVHGSNVTIAENILLHQGSGFNVGIFCQRNYEHLVICKNILMNFSLGIQAVGYPDPPSSAVIVRNNIIDGQQGVQIVISKMNSFNNTFIIGPSGTGLTVILGTSTIDNNCFVAPSQGGYQTSVTWQAESDVTFDYNDQWNAHRALGDSVSHTNISVDPLFVNVVKNNFHLGSGSLCVNAGNPLSAYNDKDGSRNDVGAYGGPDPLPEYLTFALPTDLSVTGGTAFPGDTVSAVLVLSRATGVQKADIDIRYDENVAAFVDALNTPLTNGFSITVHGVQAGSRSVHLEGASEIPSGSGAIARLRFRINPLISKQVQSAVEISGANLVDGENSHIIVSSVASGLIVVKSRESFLHRIYVDGSYSGTSNGTLLHPYPTVQQGISGAKDGDTVCIAAGVYTGPIAMKSNVYVRGSGAAATTIACRGDSLALIPAVIRFNNVRNTGIYACYLVNEAATASVIEVFSSDADIAMNKIDQSGMGMYSVMVASGYRVSIHDNYFIESKYGAPYMINLGAVNASIFRNVFSPTMATNVILLNANAGSSILNNRFQLPQEGMIGIMGINSKKTLVANNLFVGSTTYGSGIKLIGAESTSVLNNVFDVRKTGIDENGGSDIIFNNVFLGNAVGVSVSPSTSHRYNVFWKNATDVNGGNRDATEIAGDPQFINSENGNYRTAASSIVRDAGDPAAQWNDRDGSRNDAGIYGGPYADTTVFASANIRLRIGNVPGVPGDTVTVPVIASGILGMSGLQLTIEYDSQRLQLLNVHTAASTRSFSMVQKNIGQSLVTVEMSGSEQVVVDSATVAELSMLVQPGSTGTALVKFQNACVVSGAGEMCSVLYTESGIVDLTPTSVGGRTAAVPDVFQLMQNYPNPFNPATTVRYGIPVTSRVRMQIYNVLGQRVAELVNGEQAAGWYQVRWNANVSTGIYFCRIDAINTSDPKNRFIQVKKMLLLK